MEKEIHEAKLEKLRQKLAIMKWDIEHDQINPAKRVKYEQLKQECDKMESELKV